MPTTSPDSIYYADGTTPASIATITAAIATSVQNALNVRETKSYSWADETSRNAQTGMVAGEIGYQVDTDIYYIYSGSAWRVWAKQPTAYTPAFTGLPLTSSSFVYSIAGGVVNVTGTATASGAATGAISFSLPVDINSAYLSLTRAGVLGDAAVDDASSAAFYSMTISALTVSTVSLTALDVSTYVRLIPTSASIPLTWASGDIISVNFSYPVA